jgi:HAD superfamily hydrolase (TIGR01509 family)
MQFTEIDDDLHVKGIPRYEGCLSMLKAAGIVEFSCLERYVDPESAEYERLSPEQQRAASKVKELGDRKNALFNEYLENPENGLSISILPGAKELLKELKKRGVRLAIASSSKNAPNILELIGLLDIFDVVLSGHDIGKRHSGLGKLIVGKPEPDIFLAAALAMGLKFEECVGFEDSATGVRAIKDAGMRCVAVARTPEDKKLLASNGADTIVDSLEQVRFSRKSSSAGEMPEVHIPDYKEAEELYEAISSAA